MLLQPPVCNLLRDGRARPGPTGKVQESRSLKYQFTNAPWSHDEKNDEKNQERIWYFHFEKAFSTVPIPEVTAC